MSSIVVAGDSSGSITIAAPAVAGSGTLTLPVATDTLAGIAATQTLTNKTLVAPALGTPASGVLTNCTGVVAGALPAGSVLQVVQGTYSTITSTSSASFVTTNLTASITPRSTSSKILISAHMLVETGASTRQATFTIYRGATNIAPSGLPINGFGQIYSSAGGNMQSIAAMSYLDSPATASSTAYTIYFASTNGGAVNIFGNNQTGTIILMEIQG